mgnify:CR=1 FL=1
MGNKIAGIMNKIKNLPIPGKVQALIKGVLFVNAAFFIGLWLGIKIFFPDDFVLSKINEQLFVKDMALVSEDVDVSLFGNISFEEGTLTQKGNKILTFSELSFSPSIFATLGGHPAGKIHVEDINSQGGGLDATFETNENPCYSLDASELPLSILKPFLAEVVLTGSVTGGGKLCSKEVKYGGKIELSGDDVVLRGKVPTPMGDFDVGKIILGAIELAADVVDNKAEIKRLSVKGMFELDATGKVTLNTKNFSSSRLDLEISAKVPDMAKIAENVALNLLVSQLSQYKGDSENSFAFTLKGFVNKPQMGRVPRKDREIKNDIRQKKSERPQRLQRPQKSERLPQRETAPKPAAPTQAAAENVPQNDDLKKKEDELKRKEEELKQKEEAAKEREEKMREEREQREKEERERREQEEKSRMEQEARIHAAQEEAMNEIRRAREEMEAVKKARENQEEGDPEPPKVAPDEKDSEEE